MSEYSLRPATNADVPAAVRLFNKRSRAIDNEEQFSEEEVAADWSTPGFEIERDARFAVGPDDRLLGYVEVWNAEPPHVRVRTWMSIDPYWDDEVGGTGDRIAQDLLTWAREHAQTQVAKAPADARVTLLASAMTHDPAATRWIERFGMIEDRRYYRMMIVLDAPPAEPEVPSGYEIRVMRPDEHWDAYLALHESFKDHYGFPRGRTPEGFFPQWKHMMIESPDRDPDLHLVAVGPEGIVGASMNFPSFGAITTRGWVAQLGVVPGHRRKGLAAALLRRSFVEFFRKGKSEAGLGVDADSLTNALALYERCGMHVEQTSVSYLAELRPGEDYTNRG